MFHFTNSTYGILKAPWQASVYPYWLYPGVLLDLVVSQICQMCPKCPVLANVLTSLETSSVNKTGCAIAGQ